MVKISLVSTSKRNIPKKNINNNDNNNNNNNNNDNNNNNNDSNNDDKDFLTTVQFFLYSSRIPPSSDFKLGLFLFQLLSLMDTSDGLIGELVKSEEIKLDENWQDLFPDTDKAFKQAIEDDISLKK